MCKCTHVTESQTGKATGSHVVTPPCRGSSPQAERGACRNEGTSTEEGTFRWALKDWYFIKEYGTACSRALARQRMRCDRGMILVWLWEEEGGFKGMDKLCLRCKWMVLLLLVSFLLCFSEKNLHFHVSCQRSVSF